MLVPSSDAQKSRHTRNGGNVARQSNKKKNDEEALALQQDFNGALSNALDFHKSFEPEQAGPGMIRAGIERNRQDFSDRVTAFVAGTMNQLRALKQQHENGLIYIKLHEDRLKAIYAGEFTTDAFGTIYFNDRTLQPGN
jgi:hypothetical protein